MNLPPIPSALTMNSGLETSVLSPIVELFFFVAEELLREDKVGIGIRTGSSSNTLLVFSGSQPDFRFSVLISSVFDWEIATESVRRVNSDLSLLISRG